MILCSLEQIIITITTTIKITIIILIILIMMMTMMIMITITINNNKENEPKKQCFHGTNIGANMYNTKNSVGLGFILVLYKCLIGFNFPYNRKTLGPIICFPFFLLAKSVSLP